MKKEVVLFVLSLTISTSSAFSQSLRADDAPLEPINITLDDAIISAYTKNMSVNAAQIGVQAAVHRKKAAWGLGVPKLSVGATYTYMSQDIGHFDYNDQKNKVVDFLGKLPIPLPGDILSGMRALDLSYTLQKRDFAVVDAMLVVPIFTGGKITAANKTAKIGISQAHNEMLATKSRLFTEVTEFYWGLQLAYKMDQLQEEFLESMLLHQHNATELENNGVIAHAEKLFADMAVSQANAALVSSQGNTKTINTALGGAMGQGGLYIPVTELFINRNIESLDFFKQQATLNNHTLEKVELMKKLAEQGANLERSNFFPTIGAMGTVALWNYNLSDQLPKWIVGATLQWNLFNGLTREQNYMAAKAQVRQVEALKAKAEIDIATLVEKLYYQVISAIDKYDATVATINFAKEYVLTQRKAFAEGMTASSNVVDAVLNLNKAKLERMAAAYSFDVSLAQLLSLAGLPGQFSQYQMGEGYIGVN